MDESNLVKKALDVFNYIQVEIREIFCKKSIKSLDQKCLAHIFQQLDTPEKIKIERGK